MTVRPTSREDVWPLSDGSVWPLSRDDFSEANPSLETPDDPDVAKRGHLNWVGGGCALCDENASASPIAFDEEWPNPGPPCHPGCDCSVEWEWDDDANAEPSDAAVAAIENYTAKGGASAGDYPVTDDERQALDEWLATGTTEGPMYRGLYVSDDVAEQIASGEWAHELNGLTSFTRDQSRAMGYGSGGANAVKIELQGAVPGSRDIEQWSVYKGEKEVLLNGSQHLEMTDAKYESSIWKVTMKVVIPK